MSAFRPLWEANTESDFLRRVIMAGYTRESDGLHPRVGEARWGDPDERGSRWIWASGSDVINPLGFQEFPDFPIAKQNSQYAVGREVSQEENPWTLFLKPFSAQ